MEQYGPLVGYVLIAAFVVFLGSRIIKARKEGTGVRGVFGVGGKGGGKPPVQRK